MVSTAGGSHEKVEVVQPREDGSHVSRSSAQKRAPSFLLPMHQALAGIHIEHDAVGVVLEFGLCEQVPVRSHQPRQMFLASEQLGLEPMQCGRQSRALFPSLWRADQAERGVGREARRVVNFVARQGAVHRLRRTWATGTACSIRGGSRSCAMR